MNLEELTLTVNLKVPIITIGIVCLVQLRIARRKQVGIKMIVDGKSTQMY